MHCCLWCFEKSLKFLTKNAYILIAFEGTLLLVSHNRWFVQRLATRILELSEDGVFDFQGSYDDYVAHKRADHLDVQAVLEAETEKRRQAKRKKKKNKKNKR